jgi:Protein of unknown function (DUF2721)
MGRISAMLKNAGWVLIGPDMFVLAAMVTPAVMILATSSLILTTTNRLVRVVDRVREMLPEFEALASSDLPDNPKMAMLFDDLHRATVRARVGQQALAQLYLGLGAFVATSIALGVYDLCAARCRLDVPPFRGRWRRVTVQRERPSYR